MIIFSAKGCFDQWCSAILAPVYTSSRLDVIRTNVLIVGSNSEIGLLLCFFDDLGRLYYPMVENDIEFQLNWCQEVVTEFDDSS